VNPRRNGGTLHASSNCRSAFSWGDLNGSGAFPKGFPDSQILAKRLEIKRFCTEAKLAKWFKMKHLLDIHGVAATLQ
jgi:hypothetical protein